MLFQRTYVLLLAGLMLGCAYTPRVTASYYFPKAGTQVSVTQSLTCHTVTAKDKSGKPQKTPKLVSAAAVTVSTAYSSDYTGDRGSLTYTSLDGPLSDADTAMSFTDDGRLAGINASSTGEASTIISNAISLASALGPLGLIPFDAKPEPVTKICQAVKDFGSSKSSQDKPAPAPAPGAPAPPPADGTNAGNSDSSVLTLTYTLQLKYGESRKGIYIERDNALTPKCSFSLNTPPNTVAICPDANSASAYAAIMDVIPAYYIQVASLKPFHQTYYADNNSSDASANVVSVKLNRVAIVGLTVYGPAGDVTKSNNAWMGEIPVPVREYYDLPIPKAAAFGKQQFTLALSGYGSINKLEYGKTSGTSDALASVGAIAKALAPQTPEQQATALQGKSDLIYQTQRLALCQADPKDCSSK